MVHKILAGGFSFDGRSSYCGFSAHYMLGNPIISALASTWGDNIGYYGTILVTDVRERRRRDGAITVSGALKILRNLVVEFGPAEYLDSFFIRPLITYIAITKIDSAPVAIIVGKIVSDISFYIPTILAYEFRKKHLRD